MRRLLEPTERPKTLLAVTLGRKGPSKQGQRRDLLYWLEFCPKFSFYLLLPSFSPTSSRRDLYDSDAEGGGGPVFAFVKGQL